MRDKAVDEIAGILFPHAAAVIFTQPKISRAISAAQLAEMAAEYAKRFRVIPDAQAAFEEALANVGSDDAIFVTGSLYLVGELRQYWKRRAQVAAHRSAGRGRKDLTQRTPREEHREHREEERVETVKTRGRKAGRGGREGGTGGGKR
jgi:hypothetical protein